MSYRFSFLLFFACFLYSETDFRDISISEYKLLLSETKNTKQLYRDYLLNARLSDKDINSIVSLYVPNDLYKSYIYSRSANWRGVPIFVKDNIDTINLANTAGSKALLDNLPKDDAQIIKKLKKAGFVIAGKTNLSEWANFRASSSTSGWSSVGGQTYNPYNLKYNPCGSSSGSAAIVAEGIAPASIGTETNGSIVCPASINGVVGIKPTVGLVSRDGIIPISSSQDTAGPMARSVYDAAIVLEAISGRDPKDKATFKIPGDYDFKGLTKLDADYLNGKRIGVIKVSEDAPQVTKNLMDKIIIVLEKLGAEVIEISLKPLDNDDWSKEFYLLLYEFNVGLNDYLQKSSSKTRNIKQLIEFNNQNKREILKYFGQDILEESIKAVDDTAYGNALMLINASKARIDTVLEEESIIALVGLTRNPAWKINYKTGDNFENGWGNGSISAIAGYPHITIPLDYVDGLPTGVSFMGTAWDEVNLLNIAYSFEQENKFFPRPSRDKN
ncbi:MAG: amidase [Gammaproteobacteria bacterium]|nr:amidase [Gammaproteobacteria bacterium]